VDTIPSDWGMLFLSALLIEMSKTGIQGISLLAVPLGSVVLPPHCGMEVCAETAACGTGVAQVA